MSSLLDQRRHDWQASFRSMFQVWTAKLRDLEKQGAAAGEGGGLPPTQDELSRCSFYSILPQQVVLFRGGAAEGAGEEGERRLAPMIVFSSTTPQLRAKINSMGVDLRLFTQQQHEGAVQGGGSGGHDVFSEHLLNAEDVPPGGEAGTDTRAEEGDAASVHAELDAIKWADEEQGQVTIDQKKKKPAKYDPRSSANFPPLFVAGDDDYAVAYELLLNTHSLLTPLKGVTAVCKLGLRCSKCGRHYHQ